MSALPRDTAAAPAASALRAEPARFELGSTGIETCNDAACALLGCTRAELLGRSPFDFSAPLQDEDGDPAALLAARLAATRAGLAQSFQWRLQDAGGHDIETLIRTELPAGGTRLQVRVWNLTGLWDAERSLRETEMRLQQVLDHASAIVFAKDPAGRYLFVNRPFARISGWTPDHAVGRTDADLFPPDIAERFRRNDRRVLEEGQAIEFEETVRIGNETRVFLAQKFPLYDPDGSCYAVCGVASDITGRKRVEDTLRRAALAVSGAEGADAVKRLTGELAAILGTEVAFAAAFADGTRTRMHTLALWIDGTPCGEVEYALAGTPCERVVGRDFLCFPSGIREQFHGDDMFAALGIEGYAAYPLSASNGEALGLVAVLTRSRLPWPELTEAVLKIFATRIAAELEHARTEAALQASEASYRAIFDECEVAIFIHDYDTGAIVDVNPRACSNYGYSREEMRRLTVDELSSGVPPYTCADALQWIERARAGERPRFEWHRRSRDGSLHWDEVYLKRAVIAGTPRILAFTREITEHKLAEQSLRASEAQYRAVFNASVDGLVLWSPEHRVVDANPAFLAMLGCSREDMLGGDGSCFVPCEARAREAGLLAAALAGRPGQTEGRYRRADGSSIDIEVRAVPIRHRGQDHVLAVVRDITERRRAEAERVQLEAQLRQAQKMEAIGHLTGGIAHDFNNILTGVTGYLVLVGERPAALADERIGRYLGQAQLACQRARDLIQQMLTFSRGQRGTPQPLDPAALVRETAGMLRPTLPATLALTTAEPAGVSPVLIDPIQAEQVLLNLCINARDATAGNGHVHLTVAPAQLHDGFCTSCRQPLSGTFVEIGVSDSGCGIAPEVLDRMFEPFFTTKEVGKGSGMGLATVHGIVHDHGGHVLVESAPGRGTRFRVLLPALDAGAAAPRGADAGRAARAPAPAALSGHVLLAEDETIVASFLCELLEHWGLEVTLASDGLSAYRRFAADPFAFDVLLTDQTMPGATGVELAGRVHALRPQLPVIVCTGHAEQLTEATLRGHGIRALLRKPLDPAALRARLAECLAGA
ncbi:PAS domain S-box-containing protein [Plasticicumulans lactativorans]|uniref:histidine kinase n=1 Tax=Plasticicumulans lactativorans TaxID=1133106 RepID=A0A4R2LJE4_9GAMM|nr:PAS domain S-box protein [Plasticicumulans lactativorans]TCO83336.1 PAS domain S-box-containing protein [Plasticicumulans lactativorans]